MSNSTQMRPEGSPVDLQPYRMLSQDTAEPVEALSGHEDPQLVATLRRPSIDQPLLDSSGVIPRVSIERTPFQPGSASSNLQGGGISASNSQSSVKDEANKDGTVVNESSKRNSEEIQTVHTGQNNPNLAWEGWPGVQVRQRSQSGILEIGISIIIAVGVAMFLVFALLAASVHSTYPGTKFKYIAGGPVMSQFQVPGLPAVLLYPNGTIGTAGGIFWGPTNGALNLRLMEAAKFGPTILPILFAGIVGNSIRLVARWKAERGATIGTLETLVGSRSIASTVSTVLSLGVPGVTGIGLSLLWAISPLAGQASLRVLSTRNVTEATFSVPWIAATNTYAFAMNSSEVLHARADYIAALLPGGTGGCFSYSGASTTSSSAILIPMTPGNASGVSNVLMLPLPENCTSLVGLPVEGPVMPTVPLTPYQSTFFPQNLDPADYGLSFDSNISFTVSQYEFTCPSMTKELVNGSWTSMLGPNFIYANYSKLAEQSRSGSGFFLDTNATFASPFEGPQNMLFGSFLNSDVTLWHCDLRLNTRNVSIICYDYSYTVAGFQCTVLSMGVSTLSTSTPFSNYTVAASLLGLWPLVDAASPGTSSLTEQFLAQGYNATFQPELVDLSQLDNITFATRLTTIFNTWTQVATDYSLQVEESGFLISTSATPLSILPFNVINCTWFFFAILTLTSAFLLFCSVFSIWLRHRLSTPDVLGYVSSMTTQNPYVSIPGVQPGSGSALDGLKRAKLLKTMKVQIRDVQPHEEFGKFALTNEVQGYQKAEKNRRFI